MATLSRLSVIGLGYIGLPTAAVYANNGIDVIGVDKQASVVDSINRGKPHFGEPNLDAMVRQVVSAGMLKASTEPQAADAFILAVPTPVTSKNTADLSYIESAAEAIAPVLEPGNLIVLESTCPVGATEKLSVWLAEARPDLAFPHTKGEMADINIAHCPERVLPGKILEEVVHNDRVIGGMTRKCAQRALSLYRIITKGTCHLTDARTAEMAKLTENAFRDVNIAFANELSVICDELKINVWELVRLANLHPRVNILKPGPGVGGHCIAVDPWFIVETAPKTSQLIQQARAINDAKPDFVIGKIRERAKDLVKPVIAFFGITYKPDVDDLRESPALDIVARVAKEGIGDTIVVEPYVSDLPPELKDKQVTLMDFDAALEKANIVVLLVDHQAFLQVDRETLKDKIVIDTRGVW